jgi:hypothetical protein
MNFAVSATESGAYFFEIFQNIRGGFCPAPSLNTWQGLRHSAPV